MKLAAGSFVASLGMRWQITLLIVVTQIAAHIATVAIVSPIIRNEDRQQAFALDLSDPMLLVLNLLPPDVTAAHPVVETLIAREPRFSLRPALAPVADAELQLLEAAVDAVVPPVWANRLHVFPDDWGETRRGPIARPFYLAADLADGQQLVLAVTLSPLAAAVPRVVITLGLLLIAMPIMILSVWAGNMIVRPIGALADGVDDFARDTEAPGIPVSGAKEVRRAAWSFNAMRDRIAKLLKDRSLTLAAISHDMRTPLTRLRLRLEDVDDPSAKAATSDVDELERMIDDALRFLRAEEEVVKLRPTDLAVLCMTVCDNLAAEGAAATYQGPDHLVSDCDPALMRRVLENTLGNAVRHAGSGTLILSQDASTGGAPQIEITDTGPGIEPRFFETVLQPFARLESIQAGGSGSVGGFGLGLAIARQLMTRQGGLLSLHENTPSGLIVRLSMPGGQGA